MRFYPYVLCVFADRRGISAVEYALLALGIIPLVALGAATLGGGLQSIFNVVTSVFPTH